LKAVESSFIKFLQGTKQFIIPIYQRKYSWSIPQCRQLWEDIYKVAESEAIPAHFIGSIVYVEKGLYTTTDVPQLLVIDGQQRLTTLTLLLTALGRAIDERSTDEDVNWRKIRNYYLINSEESPAKKYKLVLSQNDQPTLIHIIDRELKDLPQEPAQRLMENYRFFEEQIRKTNLDLVALYRGIGKLLIVDIALDRQYDNPQLIFESLNSTGLDLTQADLIRNNILMGLEADHQESLYNSYWLPMEREFDPIRRPGLFDRFMRDFLTIKLGNIPNINEVYTAFKKYFTNSAVSVDDIVRDVYRHFQNYGRIVLLKEDDKEIRQALSDLKDLSVDVVYPFILELFDDYDHQRLSKDELLIILRTIESYVFRRTICGIPTNSLNKTFSMLAREIDKNEYCESTQIALIAKETYKRFPKDEEFKSAFVTKDMYNTRIRSYLLRKLENFDRKELISIDDYTIEHIMPQNENLSEEWQTELGPNWREIQEKYLHTIGNLTLTGYNSELSDRPFHIKKTMVGGYADSPLRLNRIPSKADHWNEEAIQERASYLAEIAVKIWRYPQVVLPQRTGVENVKEALGSLFWNNEELDAARGYFTSLRELVGDNDRLLSVTYRNNNMITINLGPWVVLRFKRVNSEIKATFIVDLTNHPELASQAESVGRSFDAKWTGDRDIRLLSFSWNPQMNFADQLIEGWEKAIMHGCQAFSHWQSSSAMRFHQPALAKALFGAETTTHGYEIYLKGEIKELFGILVNRILSIDPSIKQEHLKTYVTFRAARNIVDVMPQKSRLRLFINMEFDELYDPKGICNDLTGIGHNGNGDVELYINTEEEIDYAIGLIRQAVEKYGVDGE